MERVKGIEPSSSAWKAVALPLSYTRRARTAARGVTLNVRHIPGTPTRFRHGAGRIGGGGWIRTNVGVANGFTVRPL